ncbi:hypothetical protein [Amycolatopsis sp. NPDC051102]|uniref:hypothetical protein n=1 Tax=Amycolatopsis sp. NPDC051102 TaxID=3155163 RepID=UPI00343E6994
MKATSLCGYAASPADSGWIASAIHTLARFSVTIPGTAKISAAERVFDFKFHLTKGGKCALWRVLSFAPSAGLTPAFAAAAPTAAITGLALHDGATDRVADIAGDQAAPVAVPHPAVYIGTAVDARPDALATWSDQGKVHAQQVRTPSGSRAHDRSFFRKKLTRGQRVETSQRGDVRYKYAMGRPRLGRTANVDVPVTPELKQEFQDSCNEAGRSMTDVANELFALWVAQRRKAPKQQPLPLMNLKKAS